MGRAGVRDAPMPVPVPLVPTKLPISPYMAYITQGNHAAIIKIFLQGVTFVSDTSEGTVSTLRSPYSLNDNHVSALISSPLGQALYVHKRLFCKLARSCPSTSIWTVYSQPSAATVQRPDPPSPAAPVAAICPAIIAMRWSILSDHTPMAGRLP